MRADMNLIYIEIRHNNKSLKSALNYKLLVPDVFISVGQ